MTGVSHEESFLMCEKKRILFVCQECSEMVKIPVESAQDVILIFIFT